MKPGAWLIASIANEIHSIQNSTKTERGTFIINNSLQQQEWNRTIRGKVI